MNTNQITTVQIQGIEAETLLQKFAKLETQISELTKKPEPTENRLLTRKETAELLGVSLVTLHNWIKSGIIIAYRIGNKVRFKESEVLQSLTKIR